MGSAMVIPPGDFVVGASVSAWVTIWCGSLCHGLHRGAHPSPLTPTLVRDGSPMGLAAMADMGNPNPAVPRSSPGGGHPQDRLAGGMPCRNLSISGFAGSYWSPHQVSANCSSR